MGIRQVLKQTLFTLTIRWKSLVQALLIPCLLSLLLELAAWHEMNNYQSVILRVLDISIYCLIAINTHRIVILGEKSTAPFGLYIPTSREGSFLIHLLLMFSALIPLIFLLFLLPRVTPFIYIPIILIIYGYFVSRVSLVFPAIAIDNAWNFKDSWQVTKNYQKLMIFSVILVPLILKCLFIGVAYVLKIQVINIGLNSILTVIIITILSETYRYIESLETVEAK